MTLPWFCEYLEDIFHCNQFSEDVLLSSQTSRHILLSSQFPGHVLLDEIEIGCQRREQHAKSRHKLLIPKIYPGVSFHA